MIYLTTVKSANCEMIYYVNVENKTISLACNAKSTLNKSTVITDFEEIQMYKYIAQYTDYKCNH